MTLVQALREADRWFELRSPRGKAGHQLAAEVKRGATGAVDSTTMRMIARSAVEYMAQERKPPQALIAWLQEATLT